MQMQKLPLLVKVKAWKLENVPPVAYKQFKATCQNLREQTTTETWKPEDKVLQGHQCNELPTMGV